MACSADQPHRRRRADLDDDIEEGEIVPGYDSGSDTDDDDDSRYVLQPRDDDGRPEVKRRRLEDIIAVGGRDALLPSPTSSCCLDGTISDGNVGAAALAQATLFPCPVCRREFRSKKAVHGHMRVHDPHGRQGQEKGKKERPVAVVNAGWAVTGKRGFIGGRAISAEDEEVGDSMAIVVAEPKLAVMDPMPMAFARTNLVHESSSAEPNLNESMAIVVAAADPPNQVVVHPPAAPQFVAHQPAAPDQPSGAQGQPAAPPARDQEGRWCCKEKECAKRFASHQGLGGHMAGHKLRQNAAAAAAATAAGVHHGGDAGTVACSGSAKPAKTHVCKKCGKVLPSGVALGGHMRKHYDGKVKPKKRGASAPAPAAEAPEVTLALSSVQASQASIASAVEVVAQPAVASVLEAAEPAHVPVIEAAQPVQALVAPGSIRIFGVNIVQAPESSAASTNMQ